MDILPFWLLAYVVTGSMCTTMALRERFELSDQCLWNYTLKARCLPSSQRKKGHEQIMWVIFLYMFTELLLSASALEIKEDCQWKYTLKDREGQDVFEVEMEDLGTDCRDLYEDLPTYKMRPGRNLIKVRLEDTDNSTVQDINISWSTPGARNDTVSYLLIVTLKLKEHRYYTGPEDTRCIRVIQKPTNSSLKFQGQYNLSFNCVQIPSGTLKAVIETILRTREDRIANSQIGQTRNRFTDPLFLSTNIDAHCCRSNLKKRNVNLLSHDFCTWILSVKTAGVSLWDYILKRSDTSMVEKGMLAPIEQDKVTHRIINIEHPGEYEISITFWCSYGHDKNAADHSCLSFTREINATLCDRRLEAESIRPTGQPFSDVSSPEATMISTIVLGSVALVVIATAITFFTVRNKCRYCVKRPYRQTQNNLQRNVSDASGPLIEVTTDLKNTGELTVKLAE